MANKPLKVPIWNTGNTNNVEPTDAKKALGWEVVDDPPSGFWNFLQNLTGSWLTWLNDRTSDAGTAPRIGLRGIDNTAEDVNGNGINSTGLGTGDGVKGTGGTGGGAGVHGVAAATGAGPGVLGVGALDGGTGVDGTGKIHSAGVRGVGGATDGPGVQGEGGGTGAGVRGVGTTGYGVIAESDTTSPAKAAFRIVPQDSDPSTAPVLGDIYVNSGDKKIRMHDGSSWATLADGWEHLGTTKLGAPNADMTVGSLPLRDMIKVVIKVVNPSNSTYFKQQMNGDGAGNYGSHSLDFSGGTVQAGGAHNGEAAWRFDGDVNAAFSASQIIVIEETISNMAAQQKIARASKVQGFDPALVFAPLFNIAWTGAWVNVTDQISSIKFSANAGTMDTGSSISVFGRNMTP